VKFLAFCSSLKEKSITKEGGGIILSPAENRAQENGGENQSGKKSIRQPGQEKIRKDRFFSLKEEGVICKGKDRREKISERGATSLSKENERLNTREGGRKV